MLTKKIGKRQNISRAETRPEEKDSCPSFRPYPFTSGGHRQTLLGDWIRKGLRWNLPTEDLIVKVDEEVRLLTRVSWQPAGREQRPTLILVHGMGGNSERGYIFSTGLLAWKKGWNVLRMNMRGCGDGVKIFPGLYHAGLDQDLVAVLKALSPVSPQMAVCGFSLGGNMSLLALGRSASMLPAGLFAGAAVCPSIDLAACAEAIELPSNRHYQHFFRTDLCKKYETLQRLAPQRFETDRHRNVRTVREFDERITAFYGGFASALDYYQRSSAGPHLPAIRIPTLILSAADDPFVPAEIFSRFPFPPDGRLRIEITRTGGHLGFVGRTQAPAYFWAAERILTFLNRHHPQNITIPAEDTARSLGPHSIFRIDGSLRTLQFSQR